jgi:hypothetical protein
VAWFSVFAYIKTYPNVLPLLKKPLRAVRERYCALTNRHNLSARSGKEQLEFNLN